MSSWRRGKAYAQDLRDRVLSVDGVASGQVAARFGVSISYVVKARQRRDRLGAVTPGAQRSHTRLLPNRWALVRAPDHVTNRPRVRAVSGGQPNGNAL